MNDVKLAREADILNRLERTYCIEGDYTTEHHPVEERIISLHAVIKGQQMRLLSQRAIRAVDETAFMEGLRLLLDLQYLEDRGENNGPLADTARDRMDDVWRRLDVLETKALQLVSELLLQSRDANPVLDAETWRQQREDEVAELEQEMADAEDGDGTT